MNEVIQQRSYSRKQPLNKFGSDETLNLLFGFGRDGQAFFRAVCSQGMIYHCATLVTLCDQHMDSKLYAFLSQFPELKAHVNIQSRQFDSDTKKLEELVQNTNFHYIVMALGDDELDIWVASRFKRFYRTRHWEVPSRNESQAATSPQICVHTLRMPSRRTIFGTYGGRERMGIIRSLYSVGL